MAVIVFRNRLDDRHLNEYGLTAVRMLELVQSMPGFVSFKAFNAEDGERLALVEFESEEAAAAWGRHPEHLEAQRLGRETFYTAFTLQVCEVLRQSDFER